LNTDQPLNTDGPLNDDLTGRRIVHVITKLDVGGAQSVVRNLAIGQHNGGAEVHVITGLLGPVAEELRALGVAIHHEPLLIHPVSLPTDWRCIRSVTQRLQLLHPHMVHCHSSKGGIVGRAAAQRASIPCIYTAHGWPFQSGAGRGQRLLSFVGEWSAGLLPGAVVCVTQHDLNAANRYAIGRKKVRRLIYNGVPDIPTASLGLRPTRMSGDPFQLVTVMRLSSPKEPLVLVDVVAELPEEVQLSIIGDGDLKAKVLALVRERNLLSRIRVLGETDPAPVLASAHMFVFASRYEGMPMTVLEAMRSGLPVVSNSLPGVDEALGSASETQLSSPSIAATVRSFLLDSDLVQSTGQRNRLRWEKHFVADTMVNQYSDLYRFLYAQSAAD
jgi:glycosyltransferase involved in cell wall biosynthesis